MVTTKWTYQKNGILPVTTLFFKKICFTLRTSYKELICCTNNPNTHICAFCKRWSFIWRSFFPVNILNLIRRFWRPFQISKRYLVKSWSSHQSMWKFMMIQCTEINSLYTFFKEYAKLLWITSLRGKPLDWVKFKIQNKRKKIESKGINTSRPTR